MPTTLPDPRRYPRYAGVSTFCRYPLLADVPKANQPVDWALYGIPYDGGVSYRSGARFGPRAIRDASQYIKSYSIVHGVSITDELSLADAGDAPITPYSCSGTYESAAAFAAGLADHTHTRLFAVGGDHSIALANIRASWERRGKPAGGLALVHFDAHVDTLDTLWGETHSHASPFIRAIEAGYIDPKRMISLGIRGPLNSSADLEYAKDHGVTLVTVDEFRDRGVGVLSSFVTMLDGAEAYLSFDIDCIDPAFAPGTGTPAIGGFTTAEALSMLQSLVGEHGGPGLNLAGADIVEVLPDRDPAGTTALLAGQVMFEVLAVAAVRRRAVRGEA